jgi:hypothetical protein
MMDNMTDNKTETAAAAGQPSEWVLGRCLGQGLSGQVRLGTHHSHPHEQVFSPFPSFLSLFLSSVRSKSSAFFLGLVRCESGRLSVVCGRLR